jgi:hypothetical protein
MRSLRRRLDLVERMLDAVPDCKNCGDGRQLTPFQSCRFDASGNLVGKDGGAPADVIPCEKCGRPLPIVRLILVENREQVESVQAMGWRR